MDAIISTNFSLPGSTAGVSPPAIAISEITDLIGKSDKQHPLSREQKLGLENICKKYLEVGDGQHTQSEAEKRTDELLDLALTFLA